jgi:hypothetical protein
MVALGYATGLRLRFLQEKEDEMERAKKIKQQATTTTPIVRNKKYFSSRVW